MIPWSGCAATDMMEGVDRVSREARGRGAKRSDLEEGVDRVSRKARGGQKGWIRRVG